MKIYFNWFYWTFCSACFISFSRLMCACLVNHWSSAQRLNLHRVNIMFSIHSIKLWLLRVVLMCAWSSHQLMGRIWMKVMRATLIVTADAIYKADSDSKLATKQPLWDVLPVRSKTTRDGHHGRVLSIQLWRGSSTRFSCRQPEHDSMDRINMI